MYHTSQDRKPSGSRRMLLRLVGAASFIVSALRSNLDGWWKRIPDGTSGVRGVGRLSMGVTTLAGDSDASITVLPGIRGRLNGGRHSESCQGGGTLLTDGGVQPLDSANSTNEFREVTELVNVATQGTRYELILDMLAHPDQRPSMRELEYMNPDKGKSTISEHLQTLVEYGFVDKLVVPPGKRSRDLPWTFYRVSRLGYQFLRYHNLLPADDRLLQEQYSAVDKPGEIKDFEEAPRDSAVAEEGLAEDHKVAKLRRAVATGREVSAKTESGSIQIPSEEHADENHDQSIVNRVRELLGTIVGGSQHTSSEDSEVDGSSENGQKPPL